MVRRSPCSHDRSAPINIQDIGSVHFRLFPPGEETHDLRLIRADVAVEGATVHVILNPETGPWPFVIDNNSDYDVSFCQVVSSEPRHL
jgi:vacuolar protein sorting-associated protein 13A/C